MLLFVVPQVRLETLWPELLQRCVVTEPMRDSLGLRSVRVGEHHAMAVTSWSSLLQILHDAAQLAGEPLVEDVRQLQGLIARIERESFSWVVSQEVV